MTILNRADWRAFRQQVLECDGYQCLDCGRSKSQGVILQAHHKKYRKGALPFEYPLSEMETLCKGCHARRHGKIIPQDGWENILWEDLGEPSRDCDLCGTEIRYAFTLFHPHWHEIEVGEFCCDKLTNTKDASTFMRKFNNRLARERRFINSCRWARDENGASFLTQAGLSIVIVALDRVFRLKINNRVGNKQFSTEVMAKQFLFQLLNDKDMKLTLWSKRTSRHGNPRDA